MLSFWNLQTNNLFQNHQIYSRRIFETSQNLLDTCFYKVADVMRESELQVQSKDEDKDGGHLLAT